MFREDNIAAAQIAQIFGSELLKVQQSAKTDSGHTPDIVKLDPKQFLVNREFVTNQKKAHEQQLIQRLQREAEAACPLPQETIQPIQSLPTQHVVSAEIAKEFKDAVFIPKNTHETVGIESNLVKSIERVAVALETISKTIQMVVKPQKKKKVVLKNETKI